MLYWYWSYTWPKAKRRYLCILEMGPYERTMEVVRYKGNGEWNTLFKVLAWSDPMIPRFVFERSKKEAD